MLLFSRNYTNFHLKRMLSDSDITVLSIMNCKKCVKNWFKLWWLTCDVKACISTSYFSDFVLSETIISAGIAITLIINHM